MEAECHVLVMGTVLLHTVACIGQMEEPNMSEI